MNDKLKNAYKAVTDSDILSLSETQLIEHIQEICSATPMSTENAITQLNKIQSLCTVYNVKVIKTLSKNNTILTYFVIGLAVSSLVLQYFCK